MTATIATAPLFDLDVEAHPRQDIGPGPLGACALACAGGKHFAAVPCVVA